MFFTRLKGITLFLGVLLTLNAKDLPPIGYGTWPYQGKACREKVEEALRLGYTILDTATYYDNFEGIAKAIQEKKREDLTIISKVWPSDQAPSDLKRDLEATLKRLNTSYIDIYLLHWPNSAIPIEDTLEAMEELRKAGKIREIGVSNFTINHLKKILALNIPISWNQIELSHQFYDPELLAFCHEHGIGVQAYSPLGRGNLMENSLLTRIGSKYGKTPAQVALRWTLQHDAVPLPGSGNPKHMAENLDVYDFQLTQEEMDEINARAKNGKRNRIIAEQKLGYVDEFDFSYEECWPEKKDMSLSENKALTKAANHYLAVLNKIGDNHSGYRPEEIAPLCTKNCKKVRNGKVLFERKALFAEQLRAGKEWLGAWSIQVQEILLSTESRAATIRYELATEKEENLLVIVTLYFDENYLIKEINEVHNKLEQ